MTGWFLPDLALDKLADVVDEKISDKVESFLVKQEVDEDFGGLPGSGA